MLNEKVLFTTLKNNFDNVIDNIDTKIDASLPCKKKLIKTVIIKKSEFVAINDFFIASLDYSIGLKENYVYEAKYDNRINTNCQFDYMQIGNNNVARLIIGNNNGQRDIHILDKAKLDLDTGEPTYDANSSAIMSENAQDITLYIYSIKTLSNDFLNPDLAARNSLTVGTRNLDNAVGEYSSSFGEYNAAAGYTSHAEGYSTIARRTASHAEGKNTTASGTSSHAEGEGTTASGTDSHAEGYYTTAYGDNSHTEGYYTTALGYSSHAEGYYTSTSSSYQHVQGKYNIEDSSHDYAHIVGNGNSSSSRSNAHTLDWNGNAWFAGNVYVGGTKQDEGKELVTKDYVNNVIETSNAIKDSIALKDQITGYNYILQIRNGILTTSLVPNEARIKTNPTKLEYYAGDRFDLRGIELELINVNNESVIVNDIENMSVIPEYVEEGTKSVTIKYNFYGFDLCVDVPITVSAFDSAVVLVDFEYTSNSDGTYTITGWKQTLNGVSSTELIIPDNNKIIL